jgi:hypothetical protein
MRLETIICVAPDLPSSARGFIASGQQWHADEQLLLTATRTRGGAIVAPKPMSVQGTSVRTVRPVNADFPYIHVRAGAQDLT